MPQLQDSTASGVQACVALYDNNAETPDELSFKSGDILTIIQKESPGLEGWWICSLREKQGICPNNRLRQLTEAELNLLRERRRRSWNTQPSKVVAPQKLGESYLYDMPQQHGGNETPPLTKYDVPLSTHPLQNEESYDVPKPLSGTSLTPSSSISSLTTDSNRSSLVQQDYDVPRPSRPILALNQTSRLGGGFGPQVTYDVPRATPEVPLELNSALDLLGRLESDVTAAISRLLGYAVPHWRSKARLEPRISEIRIAVSRVSACLHQLALFVQAIHHSQQDKALGSKMGPLIETVVSADIRVRELVNSLETSSWALSLLVVETPETHQADTLDQLVSCAALLTDDIRQIASFIQGNSTLLFKRRTSPLGNHSSEETTYQNLEGENGSQDDSGVVLGSVSTTESEQSQSEEPLTQQLNLNDKKLLELYAGQYWLVSSILSQNIDSLLTVITENQPPKSFLAQSKGVVAAAHQTINLGDAIGRSLNNDDIKREVISSTDLIAEAIANLVHKTRSAALHFPSVTAVQCMVDSIVDLSHRNIELRRKILIV